MSARNPRSGDADGSIERDDSADEDVPGSPTWPERAGTVVAQPGPPPAGLHWGAVADQLAVERYILEHDGAIVLPGEYFPEAGFALDPETLTARHVDVGDMALRPAFFIGDMTVSEFRPRLPLGQWESVVGTPVIVPLKGAVIGLFASRTEADRAKRKIVQGSLGTGISIVDGPLGIEMRIGRPELTGRIATIIAGHGGSVLSIGGEELTRGRGPVATGSSERGGAGDALRGGIGATGSAEGPLAPRGQTEIVGRREEIV
jgi:hypothetical protein